jgi:hypothetical protein
MIPTLVCPEDEAVAALNPSTVHPDDEALTDFSSQRQRRGHGRRRCYGRICDNVVLTAISMMEPVRNILGCWVH